MAIAQDPPATTLDQLRAVPLLRQALDSLAPSDLAELEAGVAWYGVPGGATLTRQGDADADLFVLLAGRLGVLADAGGGPRLVHSVAPGELVGEMAAITREPRSATVAALRDSEVLRIPAALAERLLASSAPFMAFLLRQFADRLKATTRGRAGGVAVEAIAVVPIGDRPIDEAIGGLIERGFRSLKRAVEVIEGRAGEDALAAAPPGALVVSLVRERDAGARRRAMRQADRVVFVAQAGDAPDARGRAELARLAGENRAADLMLVHPAGTRPQGAGAWLGLFAADQIVHVATGDLADFTRLARLATGAAIGIALAGGGARGFAHIGAIRALYEAGVPIDHFCGTSMGALVGASAALDLDLAEVTRKVHHAFVLNRPVADYTLPLVSIARGRRMTGLLRHHFGEARIEDAWRGFFCVSSNLTTGRAHVHRDGLAWRALRASSSLPGIVPPLVEGDEVLVDGALMNNFPVDIMRSLARGRVIGVDVAADTVFRAEEANIEGRSLAWMLGPGRRKVPNIFKLLMRSGLVASSLHAEANRAAVDLLIQPDLRAIDLLAFDKHEAAIEAGYRGAMAALEGLPEPFY